MRAHFVCFTILASIAAAQAEEFRSTFVGASFSNYLCSARDSSTEIEVTLTQDSAILVIDGQTYVAEGRGEYWFSSSFTAGSLSFLSPVLTVTPSEIGTWDLEGVISEAGEPSLRVQLACSRRTRPIAMGT